MTAPLDIKIEFDGKDIAAFLAALKRFDPKLATALRSRFRKVGDEAIAEMRETILSLPVTSAKDYGVRAGIAASLTTKVQTSSRSNGVRISGSGARLGGRSAMLKALNKASFRHPVFGNREAWVTQQGRPFFGAVLQRHMPAIASAVEKAVEDATAAVNR